MIVRCSHCQQLLRVDEKSFPEGGSAKVRCPHCKVIGQMAARPSAGAVGAGPHVGNSGSDAEYPLLNPLDVTPPPSPTTVAPAPESPPRTGGGAESSAAPGSTWSDTRLPSDAFQSFRFPAERGKSPVAGKSRMSKTWRLALWAVASLVVIGFFALLVNIVLPGPGGVRPAIHTMPPHERTSNTAVKHRMGTNDEMDEEGVSAKR
jgi:predicted Zn finger-like uncharacterized protein